MPDWDRHALLWINSHHFPLLDAVLVPVSFAGEYGAIWILICVGLLIWGKPEDRRFALLLGITLIVVDRCISAPLGTHFFRLRPYLAIPGVRQIGVRWTTSSFPSGHAYSVWIGAILVGRRFPRFRVPLVVLALLTCYARPYLGMHYPLDVLSGSLIGVAAALVAIAIEQRFLMPRGEVAVSEGKG